MDKSVRKDIEKRYRDIPIGKDTIGLVTSYVCSQCQRVTKVMHKNSGYTPMGIECPYCHSDAFMTEDTYQNIEVTHEWYRPTLDDLLEMAEDGKLFTVTMVLNGGLLRREKR